jgi:hypothetical protein
LNAKHPSRVERLGCHAWVVGSAVDIGPPKVKTVRRYLFGSALVSMSRLISGKSSSDLELRLLQSDCQAVSSNKSSRKTSSQIGTLTRLRRISNGHPFVLEGDIVGRVGNSEGFGVATGRNGGGFPAFREQAIEVAPSIRNTSQ